MVSTDEMWERLDSFRDALLAESDRHAAAFGPIQEALRFALEEGVHAQALVAVFTEALRDAFLAATSEDRQTGIAFFGMEEPDPASAASQRGVVAANRVLTAALQFDDDRAATLSAAFLQTERDVEQILEYLGWFPLLLWRMAHDASFTVQRIDVGGGR